MAARRSPRSGLVRVSRALSRRVGQLRFGDPVTHVYNPLEYARAPHEAYLERFGRGPKEAVFLGMNPGPFGMAQTGVPFGEVSFVRDWMGIDGPVGTPREEHPKRPVQGFGCHRSEVSGARLWGWAKSRFGSPELFFRRFFVINYCPLAFLADSGKNVTPDKLSRAEREPLFEACDRALERSIDELEPRYVIGIGAFAGRCGERVLGGREVMLGSVLHPSPASPKANRGWAEAAERELAELGLRLP